MRGLLKIIFLYDFPVKWQIFFQDPATSIMENIIDLHHDIMFFLLIIIIFVMWMLFCVIFFFNSNNKSKVCDLNFTHNILLEFIWTIIPTCILIFIALPSYVLIYNIDTQIDSETMFTLKIIGHQWYWSYEYGDFLKTLKLNDTELHLVFDSYMVRENELKFGGLRLLEVDNFTVLPCDVKIRLLITATDVIHSWTIPSLGIKMDAVPGRLNMVGLLINRMSVFYGQCSELCGINHSFMPIGVKVINFDEFINSLKK
jgi:cytochrome c oxidase subunit 2